MVRANISNVRLCYAQFADMLLVWLFPLSPERKDHITNESEAVFLKLLKFLQP